MKKLVTLITLAASLASFAQAAPFDPVDPQAVPTPMGRLALKDGSTLDVGPGCWLRGDVCIGVVNRQAALEDENQALKLELTSTQASLSTKNVVLVVVGVLLAGAGATIGYVAGHNAGASSK